MFPKLGGEVLLFSNNNLTSIIHTANTNTNWTRYTFNDCDVTGNHDMTWCPNLGGQIGGSNNLNLTGITHTNTTKAFTLYQFTNCNLTGTHDVSMLTGLGGTFNLADNPNLTDIILPTTTQTFTNFNLNDCQFSTGLNFYPLSGASLNDSDIELRNNGMSSAIVNTMLSDFSGITSNNINTWSGITLDIAGTNSAPDTTSGGINGIAALSYLTGTPAQWSITTS